MKDKKNLLLILPILVFAFVFLILKIFNDSYANTEENTVSIPEGTPYTFSRKNIYSWHLITNNFTSFDYRNTSGTKIVYNSDYDSQAVVYCAQASTPLEKAEGRKRYLIASSMVNINSTIKNKLSETMPNMYPYISLTALKGILKTSIGSTYDQYSFDDLTVQETITAVQAAIWNILENNPDAHKYRGTIDYFYDFSSCEKYYTDKALTAEEEEWYRADGCSETGNFYKYVFKHNADSNTANRVNTLIDWYYNLSNGSSASNQSDTFSIANNSFDTNTDTLSVDINTNLSAYDITFTDPQGNVLLSTDNSNGNSFIIPNIAQNISMINVSVTSKMANQHVYYYIASTGQDFIGLNSDVYSANDTITINRTDSGGKIIIYKIGDSEATNVIVESQASPNFDSSYCGSGCLSNAKFELYYENKTRIYREITTNYSNNQSVIFSDLPYGKYYLKETQPAPGYDFYQFGVGPVDSNGYIEINVTNSDTYAVIINNTSNHMCFKKVDAATNQPLAGAKFNILDIDGSVIDTFTTGENQYCLNLSTGSYFVQEFEAPNGYVLNRTKYHFNVGSHVGTTSHDVGYYEEINPVNDVITLKNKKGVAISKSDAVTGECVAGAELVIRDINGNVVKDNEGNEIGRWISTCTGGKDSYEVALEAGTYTLTETMTDELRRKGYSSESETVKFTVDENGTVNSSLDMKDAPIKTCIYKVSTNDNTPLEGAEFEIYESDGTTLYTKFTTSATKSNNCISYIPYGTYILKETKAPDGYKILSDEITIEIQDTRETQVFYIENEVIAPKTASDTTKVLIVIAVIFMMFGLGMVGYYGFKKQK